MGYSHWVFHVGFHQTEAWDSQPARDAGGIRGIPIRSIYCASSLVYRDSKCAAGEAKSNSTIFSTCVRGQLYVPNLLSNRVSL